MDVLVCHLFDDFTSEKRSTERLKIFWREQNEGPAWSPYIRPQTAPRNGILPRVALKETFQAYKKAISSDVVARKVFKARETYTSLRVVPSKVIAAREKTVTFMNTGTFPTRETAARAIILRVMK